MIPETDIWRAALLLLKRHGERALDESAARADELALAGDDDGAATWRRIMAAVTQLANQTPPGPVLLTGVSLYMMVGAVATATADAPEPTLTSVESGCRCVKQITLCSDPFDAASLVCNHSRH
jgi:hypothetical protein